MTLKVTVCVYYSCTPRSAPHFTTQPRAQPVTGRVQWGRRGDQATENARHDDPPSQLEERPDGQGTNVERVWGSP